MRTSTRKNFTSPAVGITTAKTALLCSTAVRKRSGQDMCLVRCAGLEKYLYELWRRMKKEVIRVDGQIGGL